MSQAYGFNCFLAQTLDSGGLQRPAYALPLFFGTHHEQRKRPFLASSMCRNETDDLTGLLGDPMIARLIVCLPSYHTPQKFRRKRPGCAERSPPEGVEGVQIGRLVGTN
jgi:hypothetical protein